MLENKNKNNPFSVPENYFQNFNAEIMNMLPEKEVDNKKTIPLWKTVSRWTAIAAALVGVAFVGMHYMDTNTRQTITTVNVANTSDDSETMEEDYYQFLEEDATHIAYRDALFYE